LTPGTPIMLGDVSAGANLSCQVNIVLRVFRVPANPAPGPDFTTEPLTRATLVGASSGLGASVGGAAQITISPARATATSSTDSAPFGRSGWINTVTLKKAPGAVKPTGTVLFFLCQPFEVTAGGCVSPAGTQVGSATTLSDRQATSEGANTSLPGEYCWRVEYSGDVNYVRSFYTNSTSDCFMVRGAPVSRMSTLV
jgi:hypothetical protein